MYCFKFQKFKKLFIVFITVLTISLTIGIYTITSSAIDFDNTVTFEKQFDYTGSISIIDAYTSYSPFYFSKDSSSFKIHYTTGTSNRFSVLSTDSTILNTNYTSFVVSYFNNGNVVFSELYDFAFNRNYTLPEFDGTFNTLRFTFISKSFQLFTTRIVKNGSVIESGTAQLNKSIINPDSFTFSFYDNGLVGDSFRVSAVQTTPTTFNGSAFPPLNINIGEVAKVVIYDKDGNELGFVNGPFQENREYNIKEYFPDVDTFEIVISTPILVEETANGLTASLGWVGSVISSLVSPNGDLFPLLSLFAISICVSLLLLAFYYIRKAIWGS